MTSFQTTRRAALKAGAGLAALPLVHVCTAYAAGRLSLAFWDHWVPAGNDIMRKQVMAWGQKSKVEIQLDFITSNGFKNLLTMAAEEQAKSGHDVHTFPNFEVHNHAGSMEPLDDVVQRLVAKYGPINPVSEYLCTANGRWLAVPGSWGSQNKGPCGRISILKDAAGLDVVKMYPAFSIKTPEQETWTWDAHQKAAEACNKIGKTFGIGLGITADSVDTAGALFRSHGAAVVDEKGEIAVESDAVRRVLEFGQRMVRALPDDAVAYDDASNNRALISGASALIWNPPSAWAVAVRDNPAAIARLPASRSVPAAAAPSGSRLSLLNKRMTQFVGLENYTFLCWTFPAPKGPNGRFRPVNLFSFGIWSFSPNKTAAKELIEHLMQREQVEARLVPTQGYDQPPFISMTDFKIWEQVEPPKGTVFNYPIRPHHDEQPWLAGMEAPPEIAVQMYNRGTVSTMLAKLKSGQSIKQVTDWAKEELEGFVR
jgi:ABC-type glycerol-3-phosphate transport system substrate-binding protein